jgi:hypothetical protein
VDERNAEKMVITTPRQKPSKKNPDKQNDQIKYKALATCNDSFFQSGVDPSKKETSNKTSLQVLNRIINIQYLGTRYIVC